MLPWKKPGKKWYGKTRVTSWKLIKARVESQKCDFKYRSHEFRFTSCEFNFTNYEFKFTSYEFKSRSCKFESKSSRIFLLIKTEVNILKISSFPKILSLKSFGNSWGNSSVQFLVIIPYFTFALLHGYGFSRKQS